MAFVSIPIEKAGIIIPAMRRGISSALNKVMSKASTSASREVRKVYNIKARDIKQRTKIIKANINRAIASFSIEGSRMKLLLFGARDEYPKGVTVMIKKGSRKRLRSAFVAKMPSGLLNVFIRTTEKRLPIKSLRTLDIATMYNVEGEKAVEKIFNNEYLKIMEHEIDFRLSKIK
jgi:hypothetical protein